MIKLTFCVRRLDSISESDFHDYWLNQHGPLVKSVSEVLKIRKYIQTHAIDTPVNAAIAASRGAPERLDGIAELWWTEDDFAASGTKQEARDAGQLLYEDEAKFIDFTRSPLWYNREHVILDNT